MPRDERGMGQPERRKKAEEVGDFRLSKLEASLTDDRSPTPQAEACLCRPYASSPKRWDADRGGRHGPGDPRAEAGHGRLPAAGV